MWLTTLTAFSLLPLVAFGQSEPRFRLSKASIVILAVTDLNRALEFYRDRLGLNLSSTNEEFAFWTPEDSRLHYAEAVRRTIRPT